MPNRYIRLAQNFFITALLDRVKLELSLYTLRGSLEAYRVEFHIAEKYIYL